MRQGKRLCGPLSLLLIPLLSGCDEPTTPGGSGGDGSRESAATLGGEDDHYSGTQIPFDEAQAFFEFNTTDDDLGLQIFLDAEGWRSVGVSAPAGDSLVQIVTEGNLSELGITELRFESAEPSPGEVMALFPPGDYAFRGTTVGGDSLSSTATLSHDFLPAPTFTPSEGEVVDRTQTVVTWEAPNAEQVEVIVENEELGHVFDVIVPGTATSLDVPPQFLQPGTEYSIEILAIAANGNRTIAESEFATMP